MFEIQNELLWVWIPDNRYFIDNSWHYFVVKSCTYCQSPLRGLPIFNITFPTQLMTACPHSSVFSCAPSILLPRVWVPSEPSPLKTINIWFLSCRKYENKQKEARIGPFKKLMTPSFKEKQFLLFAAFCFSLGLKLRKQKSLNWPTTISRYPITFGSRYTS